MRNVTHCACIYMGLCVHVVPMSILMCLWVYVYISLFVCCAIFVLGGNERNIRNTPIAYIYLRSLLSVVELSGVVT